MNETTLRRMDAAAAGLLTLWAGAVLGFALGVAPLLFRMLPSRDLAGAVAGLAVARLDVAAWIAFGGAAALAWLPRWLAEVSDADAVGPLRLWTAALLVALLMTFASTFILTPKLNARRQAMGGSVQAVAEDHPDRRAYQKVHGLSRQMMLLRVLLALGLAGGAALLPRRKAETPEG